MIKNICIVGGGHAGWWTAAYIEKHLPTVNITLYESNKIPILGVGESTLPQVKLWFDELGIPEEEWMDECSAIKKFGNYKDYWDQEIKSNPFILYFWQNNNNEFDSFVQKSYTKSQYQKEFSNPQGWRDYGYHLDAHGAANIVKKHCSRTKCIVEDVDNLPPGYDLYVDCTGFHRKFVLDKTLMQLNKNHLVDRALVCNIKLIEEDYNFNFTKSIARKYGWQFYIPLQNRVGVGYVYSSSHVSDEDARDEFMNQMIFNRTILSEPKLLKWKPLVYSKPWYKNVVAIGSSAGFIDPLEATSLYMTQLGITTLVKCLKRNKSPNIYNKLMLRIWKQVSDFQLSHYGLSNRTDTTFWKHLKNNQKECKKKLWQNYSLLNNKHINLFPSGIWAQLGVYLDDFEYYRPNTAY